MRRYKDPKRQQFYDRLRELGTPEALTDAKIFGAIAAAFRAGYEGRAIFIGCPRTSAAWAAYMAGKDSKP